MPIINFIAVVFQTSGSSSREGQVRDKVISFLSIASHQLQSALAHIHPPPPTRLKNKPWCCQVVQRAKVRDHIYVWPSQAIRAAAPFIHQRPGCSSLLFSVGMNFLRWSSSRAAAVPERQTGTLAASFHHSFSSWHLCGCWKVEFRRFDTHIKLRCQIECLLISILFSFLAIEQTSSATFRCCFYLHQLQSFCIVWFDLCHHILFRCGKSGWWGCCSVISFLPDKATATAMSVPIYLAPVSRPAVSSQDNFWFCNNRILIDYKKKNSTNKLPC